MTDPHGPEAWESDGPVGSTPLDPDEAAGLIPTWVATRGDLNQVESENIILALDRRRWRHPTTVLLLDDLVVRNLHADMFGKVWCWAGSYRQREVTIGVDPDRIATCVRDLVDDAKHWFQGARPMPLDEAGYRFHHRLVQIHPFPNGNGRHSRAITDLLLLDNHGQPFTWGSADLDVPGGTRNAYIAALRAADDHDYQPLARFVRS